MAIIKDFATIVKEMEDLYKIRLPQANRGAGALVKEAFVNIPGSQLAFLHSAVAQANAAKKPATSTGADLDALASNFNIVRNAGTQSTGLVYVILPDNFPNGQDVVINDGQIVSTQGQRGVDFRIVGQVTLSVASASLFEAEANRRKSELSRLGLVDVTYLAIAPISAVNPGTNGNVGVGAIRIITVAGVRSVVNLEATVGGLDAETDASLRERISLAQVSLAIGTSESYKATALESAAITSAFVVSAGDSLMTRDGTVVDSSGNILQEGSGRAVDIWAKGSTLVSADEDFVYTDKTDDQEGPVAVQNQRILGYEDVTDGNIFSLQPVRQITSVVGSESGSNFVVAVETEDEENNTLLEGNYFLLKDISAGNYSIVREVATGRLKVARTLSPFSTKYTLVRQLVTGDFANSARGADKLIFTSDRININDEAVTRSTVFGGADALLNTDVLEISDINEEIVLSKEIVALGTDHRNLQLKHKPIVSVAEVKHVRLGAIFTPVITNATTGVIQISGKFIPQTEDLFQVTYTWNKNYIRNLEYFLVGDSVSWEQDVVEADKRESSTLLATRTLDTTNSLDNQPLTPTFLRTRLEGVAERARVTLTLKGDTAEVVEGEDSRVLETNEQDIVLKKGITTGSVVLEQQPEDPAEIEIYYADDVFRRNIVDTRGNNTYDEQTQVYDFTINTVLFDNFFSSTDNELEFIVSYEVDKPFTFKVNKSASVGRVGKILRVRNLTSNVEYNLLDYSLRTNLNDRRAIVDESLAGDEFRLSELANQTVIDIGDKMRFKRLPTSLHWTSKSDFENNVGDNATPTIDESKIEVEESGNVRLKTTTEQAVIQSTIQVAGSITSDIAWSGSVEVLDDVTVNSGVTLLIRAGTIIRVREQDRTGKKVKIEIKGRLVIDSSATAEDPIIFTSAAASKAAGDWEGIVFSELSRSLDTSLISNLAFCEIRYANNAVHVDGSNPRIRFNRFSNCLQRGLLYTSEPDEVSGLVIRDANGNTVGWSAAAGAINETRIALLDTNGAPIKLMSSNEEAPFGITVPGTNTGIDDGLGPDGIPGTADDGYGADGIPGTADDGYGPDGLPASASTPTRQIIHFTSSSYTQNADVLNPEGVTPKFALEIDGVTMDVSTYAGGIGVGWTVDKENAWVEYVGEEETFYLVLYKNTTATTFTSTSVITFSYLAPRDCGLLYQNIVEDNTITGMSVNANVNLTVAGNTFYGNGLSCIDAKDCYLVVRNNFLQEYSTIPLSFDFKTIARVSQNNAWSSLVEAEVLDKSTDKIILATDIDATQTTIEFIFNPDVRFRSGQIIQIQNEKVRIKAATVSTDVLQVTRGVQGTIPASHRRGITALFFGDRALFMVTGVPGSRCEILQTDVNGDILDDVRPLQMIRAADGTFTLATSLDRSEDYRYRYRYVNPANNIVLLLSKMRTLPSMGTSIGDTAIDVFNPIHEAFYFKQTNYSIDPLFQNSEDGNYDITSDSPSHKDSTLYASEISVFTKYQGRERVQEVKNFTATDIVAAGGSVTTLTLQNSVVIESSVRLDVEIFVPTGASAIFAQTFDDNTKIVTLDPTTPITVAGTYLVQYFKPVNLGSSFPGYNYLGELSYVVDAKQTVDFTNFVFSHNALGGGSVDFQFRSPDPDIENPQITDLSTAAFGPVYNTSPIELEEFRTVEGGPIESQFLEVRIQLRSNWKGFDANDVTQFPILEDMTLSMTSASDQQTYVVKASRYKPTTDRTEFTIVLDGTNDTGITESTFKNVGSDEKVNVTVWNSTAGEFQSIAIATRIVLNAITIETIGNLTTVFPVPVSADIYLVDYLWITQNTQEEMVFIEDADQTTENRFVLVNTIVASIIKDRQVLLPEEEEITVSSTSEPEAGVNYETDYEYVAPKDNEVIEVDYSYNDAIRTTAQDVEDNKDLVADVLVREVINVGIRIEAELEVLAGEIFANVIAEVSVAIAAYFDGFQIGETSKIDDDDIIAVIKSVEGVDSVKLTVFNLDPESGVVESILLDKNENPVLGAGSPEFSESSDTANIATT